MPIIKSQHSSPLYMQLGLSDPQSDRYYNSILKAHSERYLKTQTLGELRITSRRTTRYTLGKIKTLNLPFGSATEPRRCWWQQQPPLRLTATAVKTRLPNYAANRPCRHTARQCCRPHGQTTVRHDKHAGHREDCELPSISCSLVIWFLIPYEFPLSTLSAK